MKGARPKQLSFVFADSPTGSRGTRVSDESRAWAYLLHTAKGMSETDLAAREHPEEPDVRPTSPVL
jgi:hypothetical protein